MTSTIVCWSRCIQVVAFFHTLTLAGLGPAHHTGVNSSHGDAAFVEASKLYARRKEAHLSGVTVQPRGALDVDTASDKSALTVLPRVEIVTVDLVRKSKDGLLVVRRLLLLS